MKDERCFDLFIQSFLKLSSPLGIKFIIYLSDIKYLWPLRNKLEQEYELLPHTAMRSYLDYLNDNKILIVTLDKGAIKYGRADFGLCDCNIPKETIKIIIRPQCNLCFDLNYIDLERLFQIEGEITTANTSAWYHATSKSAANAANASQDGASEFKSEGYTELELSLEEIQAAVAGSNGKKDVYYVDSGESGYDEADAKYYVKYVYYLKTSTEGTTNLGLTSGSQNVNISVVSVEGNENSTNLNKAMRVGIAIGSKFYIFAPIEGATETYFVNATTETTAIDSSASTHDTPMSIATALTSLPGMNGDPTPVYIYMWYEGEDENCKSDNITATLDELTVNVEFKLVTLEADAEDVGIEI